MVSFPWTWSHTSSGVYFDGHERSDVVLYRNEFLARISELDQITITSDNLNPVCPDDVKPLIRVVHDESTYCANCNQSYFWGDNVLNTGSTRIDHFFGGTPFLEK